MEEPKSLGTGEGHFLRLHYLSWTGIRGKRELWRCYWSGVRYMEDGLCSPSCLFSEIDCQRSCPEGGWQLWPEHNWLHARRCWVELRAMGRDRFKRPLARIATI